MYTGLRQSVRYCCKILMHHQFSGQAVQKHPNVKFNENPSIGVAELFHADGRTDRQTGRQRDVTNLIITFRNFANVPQKPFLLSVCHFVNRRCLATKDEVV